MRLPYGPRDLCGSDVGQILAIFAGLVNNIENATINLPDSHKTPSSDYERWSKATECLMTGKATDNKWLDGFWLLENHIHVASHFFTRATGLQSKAAFQRFFGQIAVLTFDNFEKFSLSHGLVWCYLASHDASPSIHPIW